MRGLRYSRFAADIFDGPDCFDGFQYGDDLVFSESGFAHGDLLKGHIEYVGRSLKVNGADCRDAYKGTGELPQSFYILAQREKRRNPDHPIARGGSKG